MTLEPDEVHEDPLKEAKRKISLKLGIEIKIPSILKMYAEANIFRELKAERHKKKK